MIAQLTGKLADKQPSQVIVDAGGVGYLVKVSLNTLSRLPQIGQEVTLKIHTHVREDDISLFGFHSLEEKDLFQALIAVNKIGPKLAVTILSGMTPQELKSAINQHNTKKISSIPGIGKKMAERLVLELGERFTKEEDFIPGSDSFPVDEAAGAVSALMNLGYKKEAAQRAVKLFLKNSPDPPGLETLIKGSLKLLIK